MAIFSPEQWNALSPHLDSALSLDESGRESYLASLGASDPQLAAELRELLNEHAALGRFLEGSAMQPEAIGPYRIVGTLGEGGMGIVYLAEQTEPIRRRLAIKVIRLLGGRHLIARFESERQALAMMEHPHIARLYEAGVTAEGHPYFAMEFVDGVPITRYCDEHQMPVRERLQLFQQVCGAVQHAHQKGVIHRDLKPSNILVVEQDGAPAPKVIDFGLAKALHTELTAKTLHTEAGARMGTLRYMSPEQERGSDIDSTTDIYSLGVLLYELLTSVTPRDALKRDDEVISPLLALKRNKDAATIASNRGTTLAGLQRLIKGDIEWIALKALEQDRAKRYASASEFAADIGRYLSNDVVMAHAPGALLRFQKLVRRHRLASAVGVAVIAGFIGTGVAAAIAFRERGTAQQRMIEMRQLAGKLLFELHDEIVTLPGATKAREKLAATSSEYLQKLESQGKVDPEVAWELAAAYSRLSDARGGPSFGTGDSKSAIEYSRRTLEFGRIAETKRDMDDAKLQQLFVSYVRTVDVFKEARMSKEAREGVERLLALAPRVAPPNRITSEAMAHKLAGDYYDRFVSRLKAIVEYKQAVDLYRQDPTRPDRLANGIRSLARTQGIAGDFDGALASFEEALKLSQGLVAAQPANILRTRDLCLNHIWIADLLAAPDRVNLGRPETAIPHYTEAIRIAESLVAADPKDEMAKLDVARACGKLGSLLAQTEPAKALALMDRSAAMIRGTSFGNTSGRQMRLVYLTESVTPLVAMGRLDQARRHTEESRQMRGSIPSIDDDDLDVRVSRKEAEWMSKSGLEREAVRAATRVKELTIKNSNLESLSDGYQLVLALEALQTYTRKIDPQACRQATDQVAEYWEKALPQYPNSTLIAAKAREAKARAQNPAHCQN